MLRRSLPLAVALAAVALPLAGHGGEPDGVEGLMRRKLDRSQKVLEGIATGNLKQVAKNSEELIALSKEAGWRVLRTPRYELYSDEFQRAAEDLIKHSKAKNLDAAALSYVDLTLTCVKCHKYVREVRTTRLDGDEIRGTN
jgi:hypothetical protein